MEKVTVENIFSHVIHDNDTCEMVNSDCYMGIFTHSNHQGVNIVTSTLKEGKIIGLVNEFLSLIKANYPVWITVYTSIVDRYNSMMLSIQHNTPLTIDDSCVFFIPTFANGTIHGYVAVYTFLEKYIQNIDTLGHRTIVMYKDAQKGINELFCTAFHNIFIERRTPPPRILYLDSNKIVHMKDIVFIRNHHHYFPSDLIKPLFFTSVFNPYILPHVPNISQVSSIAGKNTRNMCMMKTNESENTTTVGVFLTHSSFNCVNGIIFTILNLPKFQQKKKSFLCYKMQKYVYFHRDRVS